ncbi:MAG: oligosaccharide flippase family protein [Candidatus Bathyarchaeia archaeon]
MNNLFEMGKTSATGSYKVFAATTASTIIMAIGSIIVSRLIGPEDYGLYSIALIPSNIIIIFRGLGIDAAITKYSATLKAQNMQEKAREIITAGLLFEVLSGFLLTLLLILLSNFIAFTIFRRSVSSPLISLVSITIFLGAIITASQSSFKGLERMELYSLTILCQATVKTFASSLLVFIGYGALGLAVGYLTSFIVTALVSLLLLWTLIFKNMKKDKIQKTDFTKNWKRMLSYGVPLHISSIIIGFLAQFYAFIMAIYCTTTLIGNYQIATQFAILLTLVTTPISTVLFPIFSKIDPKMEVELLQTVFSFSVKYTAIILVPATAAVMALSHPMINTIFGEKWATAPYFLTLYVIGNLYALFGNLSLDNFLAGIGETKIQMKLSLITLAFGIPLAFLLLPPFGLSGLIAGSIVSRAPAIFIGLHWVRKKYKVKISFASSFKILSASAIAALAAFLAISLTAFADWIDLAIGGFTFIAAYLILAPLIGAITPCDIKNLKALFSGLGLPSKIINLPLVAMEKLSDAFGRLS